MNTVATGTATDLANIGQYAEDFSPGDGGLLHIDTYYPVSQDVANWFQEQLDNYNIELWGNGIVINADGADGIDIYFKVGQPQEVEVSGIGQEPLSTLAIMGIIVAAGIAVALIILASVAAWKLSQLPASDFTPIIQGLADLPWILVAGLVLLGGVLIYRVIPARKK
jgi:hypothetical protein